MFLACHQLDPSGGELFHEIWYELKDDQLYVAKKRLNARPLDWLQPQSDIEVRQALFRIVAQAVERLETIAETHRKRAEINAHLIADLLAFDGNVEGERLRRYETSCGRALLRTLDAFDKRHRAAADDDDDNGIDLVVPASIDECLPVSAVEIETDVEITTAFAAESTEEPIQLSVLIANSAIFQAVEPADARVQSQRERAATGDNAELPNEPTAFTSRDHNPELPNEPTAATRRHHNAELPNEPMAATRLQHNAELPNEPTAATRLQHNAELPNEPTAATRLQHNAELPNEPTAPISEHLNAELPNEPTAATSRHRNSKLPNEPTAFTSGHPNAELPNEPTAAISLKHSGGRKQIESGAHRRDRDAKPMTGPNRRERRARLARSRKTESDLTWLHPLGNHLNRTPP